MAQPHEVWHGWMHQKKFRITREYAHQPQFKKGDVVKAVMVSRFDDVGVTKNLEATHGYDLRVEPWELEPIEPVPGDVCKLCFFSLRSGGHENCRADRKCEICGGDTGPGDPKCRGCRFKEWERDNVSRGKR